MAKAKTRATLSPETLTLGQPIRRTDVQTVLGAHGYAVGSTIETLISSAYYTDSPGTEPTLLAGAGTDIVEHLAWIPPHAVSVDVHVEIELGSGSTATGEVTVNVGSGSATFSRAGASAAQPASTTIATSSTGTGWQSVTVEGEVTSGTDAAAALGKLRVATSPIAVGDLADPTVE